MIEVVTTRIASMVRGGDGDRASDHRSITRTWPWTQSCVPCTSRAVRFQGRAERRETGVSYSIYELKSYNEISTGYIREGETRGDGYI